MALILDPCQSKRERDPHFSHRAQFETPLSMRIESCLIEYVISGAFQHPCRSDIASSRINV
jgi:hypothetical protein